MSRRLTCTWSVATLVAAGLTATTSAQSSPAAQQTSQSGASVTIVGCVQKETDVLTRKVPIPGNPGMADEFVLTQASLKSSMREEDPQVSTPEPAGTSGTASSPGTVYRATGDKEADLKNYVGQRVEITGSFKNADDAARAQSPVGTSGTSGTSGAAAPATPTVENTPEFTVQSITAASGSCSPVVK